jgi:ATP-dependent DNA helicase PIF1
MELSPEQLFAFNRFKQGQNLFISGPGGSGKSYFIKYIVEHLYKRGVIHQVTSTTGCSSILLANNIHINGKPIVVKTIHSWSGIRLGKGPIKDIVSQVLKRDRVVKEWRRCKVLMLDEISMMSKKIFNTLDTVGRTVRGRPNEPFGGIQLVFLGDFYQLPPVGDYGDPETSQFCFESAKWFETFPIENHVEFTTIFRQRDETFKRILNEIRCGALSPESTEVLSGRINALYDPELHEGILPMKIFATRNQVSAVNTKHYDELETEEMCYVLSVSTNTTKYIETGEPFEPDVTEKISMATSMEMEYEIKSMSSNVPMDETVRVKEGAIVMCLVNLDLEQGISNGSVGRIIGFAYSPTSREQVPIVKYMNGVVMQMERHVFQSMEYPNICVAQIPLCLAYASSIHKMQGATLDVCEMNLGTSIFAEHQTYVALSRVRDLSGVYLTDFNPSRIKVNPIVVEFYKQFVKPEINTVSLEEEDDPIPEPPVVGLGDCPICLSRPVEAQITLCRHIFCKSCINRHLQCNLRDCAQCPMCRQPISAEMLKPMGGGWGAKKTAFKRVSSSYKVQKI